MAARAATESGGLVRQAGLAPALIINRLGPLPRPMINRLGAARTAINRLIMNGAMRGGR